RTAFRETHEHVVDTCDPHSAGAPHGLARRGAPADLRKVDHVVVFELVAYAVSDGLCRSIAEADCGVEIGRRAVIQTRRNPFQERAARHVGAQTGARELLLEHLLTGKYVLFTAFLAEPLLDFVLGARRLDDRKPVERGPPARFVDEDFADIAVLHAVIYPN